APSLVRRIAETPGQELATHTFSHYFCGEAGADPEAFRADLRAALDVAADRGHDLRSIVFPRNQYDARYLRVCAELGIRFYRGNPASRLWGPPRSPLGAVAQRAGRWLDDYVRVGGRADAPDPASVPGLPVDVPADRFLRPLSPRTRAVEPLRLRRIGEEMRRAAETGGTYHLWWHPHNFGAHPARNLAFLARVLDRFGRLRDARGMRSATMAEAGADALPREPSPASGLHAAHA
ncbi:MAG TPA: hypothetical protein VFY65_06760, partial [Longimicrobium sp.]|nr:hypothetical protein [Longimicrobium sp.]